MSSHTDRIGLGGTPPPFALSRATAAKRQKLFAKIAAFNRSWELPESDSEAIRLLNDELAILESVEPVLVAIEKDHAPALVAARQKAEAAEGDARQKLIDAGLDAEALDKALALHPQVKAARAALSPILTFSVNGSRRKTADLIARCQRELEACRRRAARDQDSGHVNRSRPLHR